jgi:trehalose utilization protein
MPDIRVTVWNEFRHEKKNPIVAKLYPKGMHAAIAEHLNRQGGIVATTATLDEPEQGLSADRLAATDVLLWWGHVAHAEVLDATAERVCERVRAGMGLIGLHSAHMSKVFGKLMGTSCQLRWREAAEKERLWVVNPSHPIVNGVPPYFELAHEEMYGEHFDVPTPDELVLISWFEGGEVFRSGCTWTRSRGKIFYFRPGHETYPSYHDANVLKVIANAVRWAKPAGVPEIAKFYGAMMEPIETIRSEKLPGLTKEEHPKA